MKEHINSVSKSYRGGVQIIRKKFFEGFCPPSILQKSTSIILTKKIMDNLQINFIKAINASFSAYNKKGRSEKQ